MSYDLRYYTFGLLMLPGERPVYACRRGEALLPLLGRRWRRGGAVSAGAAAGSRVPAATRKTERSLDATGSGGEPVVARAAQIRNFQRGNEGIILGATVHVGH